MINTEQTVDAGVYSNASLPPDTFITSWPERSDWQCRLTGDTVYRPAKGNEPNWFHRKMQELAFGFRWERVKK